MSITINSHVNVSTTWTTFKSFIILKNLNIQYDNDGTVYTIYAFDNDATAYSCTIWIGTVPSSVINSGYSQSQNNSDLSDFTTNYLSTANQKINYTIQLFDGYSNKISSTNGSLNVNVANQASEQNVNLNQVSGSAISLGQTTMSASLPVVIASNQSTLNSKDAADGPVTPGAVASNSSLIGAQFNTVLPTLTNTQQSAIQSDSNGRILIGSIASALPSGTNTIGFIELMDGYANKISSSSGALSITGYVNQGLANIVSNAWPTEVTDGTNTASVFPGSFLRVTDEPHQLFYDPFDIAFDTTNRWNNPTTSGSGVAASNSSGNMTLATGTTASSYSKVTSQPTFIPTIPGWLSDSWANKFESSPITNAERFWGRGTLPTTPTTSAPVTDGCGFEIFTDGKMYAVTYSNGTRTAIQDLSSATGNGKQPVDGNFHRYIVFYRTDRIFWYIDSIAPSGLVASASFPTGPTVQSLPLAVVAVGGATPPASSAIFTSAGVAVSDTAKNNIQLSDGYYPWRKTTIKQAASSSQPSDNAIVTALRPTNAATITSVAAAITSTTLLAANSNRQMATIYNNGTGNLFVAFAGTASTSSFTVRIVPNSYYELPLPVYQGQITGIGSVTGGSWLITEQT